MPRIGRHPLKQKGLISEVEHETITVATIVHIPMLEGYWEHSLDVLKLFFESLLASTKLPFDLLVFDNNSCEEVQDYLLSLKNAGKIQYLTLSRYNLRKLGALNYLLSIAPGEYIAYADSDVLFLNGWLSDSLDVLSEFDKAGYVTALPLVGGDAVSTLEKELNEIKRDPSISVEIGELIPELYIEAHRKSLSKPREAYAIYTENRRDVLLTRNGISAYLRAADFQFTIRRSVLRKAQQVEVSYAQEYHDPIYTPILEKQLVEAGYVGMSTTKYLVHHLGNHVPDFSDELPWLDIGVSNLGRASETPHGVNRQWNKRRPVRHLLKWLNSWSYRALYERN